MVEEAAWPSSGGRELRDVAEAEALSPPFSSPRPLFPALPPRAVKEGKPWEAVGASPGLTPPSPSPSQLFILGYRLLQGTTLYSELERDASRIKRVVVSWEGNVFRASGFAVVDGDGNPLQIPYRLDMADLVWEVDQHGRFARGLNTDELVEIESQKVIKMLATKADSADTGQADTVRRLLDRKAELRASLEAHMEDMWIVVGCPWAHSPRFQVARGGAEAGAEGAAQRLSAHGSADPGRLLEMLKGGLAGGRETVAQGVEVEMPTLTSATWRDHYFAEVDGDHDRPLQVSVRRVSDVEFFTHGRPAHQIIYEHEFSSFSWGPGTDAEALARLVPRKAQADGDITMHSKSASSTFGDFERGEMFGMLAEVYCNLVGKSTGWAEDERSPGAPADMQAVVETELLPVTAGSPAFAVFNELELELPGPSNEPANWAEDPGQIHRHLNLTNVPVGHLNFSAFRRLIIQGFYESLFAVSGGMGAEDFCKKLQESVCKCHSMGPAPMGGRAALQDKRFLLKAGTLKRLVSIDSDQGERVGQWVEGHFVLTRHPPVLAWWPSKEQKAAGGRYHGRVSIGPQGSKVGFVAKNLDSQSPGSSTSGARGLMLEAHDSAYQVSARSAGGAWQAQETDADLAAPPPPGPAGPQQARPHPRSPVGPGKGGVDAGLPARCDQRRADRRRHHPQLVGEGRSTYHLQGPIGKGAVRVLRTPPTGGEDPPRGRRRPAQVR